MCRFCSWDTYWFSISMWVWQKIGYPQITIWFMNVHRHVALWTCHLGEFFVGYNGITRFCLKPPVIGWFVFLGLAIAKQTFPVFFLTIYRLFSLPLCSKWLSVVFFAIHFMAGAMTEDKVTRGRPPATEMKHGRSDPKMPLFHQANIGFWGLEFWWILGMICM